MRGGRHDEADKRKECRHGMDNEDGGERVPGAGREVEVGIGHFSLEQMVYNID